MNDTSKLAPVALTKDQIIQLLNIYSTRENFHIAQHHTRANFFIGFVVSGLSLACLIWAQYRSAVDQKIIALIPLMMIGVAQIAITSLKRTYIRVNENMATRVSLEQILGLQANTEIPLGKDHYYFPEEPIRPIYDWYRNELRNNKINKSNFAEYSSKTGQQFYWKLLFRSLQLFAVALFVFLLLP